MLDSLVDMQVKDYEAKENALKEYEEQKQKRADPKPKLVDPKVRLAYSDRCRDA